MLHTSPSLQIDTEPEHGAVELAADGSFTYTPEADFAGEDSFTYRASDGTATSEPAKVSLIVTPANDAPVAMNDEFATGEDEEVVVEAPGVLGNDTDIDRDDLSAALVSPPTHGTLAITADGSMTYTPDPDWCGTDSFTYTIADEAGETASASVTAEVSCVNDAPAAVSDEFVTDEDVPLVVAAPVVLENDVDVDGDAVTVVAVGEPAVGELTVDATGTLEFSAPPDWSGVATVAYTIADPSGLEATAEIKITVEPVNDPPVVTLGDVSPAQSSDGIAPIAVTATDVDSPSLELALADLAPELSLELADVACTEAAEGVSCDAAVVGTAVGPAGDHGFSVTAIDDGGESGSSASTISVSPEDARVLEDPENPDAIQVPTPGGSSDAFSLTLLISEQQPDVANGEPLPGDISAAEVDVRLEPVGPGSLVPGDCASRPVVDDGFAGVLEVECSFDAAPVNVYSIVTTVTGGYYQATGEGVLTVFDPSLGFSTGGGAGDHRELPRPDH